MKYNIRKTVKRAQWSDYQNVFKYADKWREHISKNKRN